MKIGNNHRDEDELIASVRSLVIGWMSSRNNVEEMKEELQELCAKQSVAPLAKSLSALIRLPAEPVRF